MSLLVILTNILPPAFCMIFSGVPALLHPDAVSEALAKEVSRGHAAGLFTSPPIPNLQCSPLGVVPKKDGTWHIIMDLSSPHGSSINGHVSKALCIMPHLTRRNDCGLSQPKRTHG